MRWRWMMVSRHPCLSRNASARSRHRGFTLVEVMVALVVVGVALPALMVSVYRQIDGVGYLRDKAVAGWVAANRLTEARIRVNSGAPLRAERDSGVEEMAAREWYWWIEREQTQVADMYRVTVTVAASEDEEKSPLVTLDRKSTRLNSSHSSVSRMPSSA